MSRDAEPADRVTAIERRALIAVIPVVWIAVTAIIIWRSTADVDPVADRPEVVAAAHAAARADSLAADSVSRAKSAATLPASSSRGGQTKKNQPQPPSPKPAPSPRDFRNEQIPTSRP